MNWEKQQISRILKKTTNYFTEKKFEIHEKVENSRDGGYVLYSNKSETIKVMIRFLPYYDVEIQYFEKPLKYFLKFLLNREVQFQHISIKDLLNKQKVVDFESFIEEAVNYIEEKQLLSKWPKWKSILWFVKREPNDCVASNGRGVGHSCRDGFYRKG